MSLRIRKNGSIVCAAMTQEEDGDTYINDDIHYYLSVLSEAIRPSKNHENDGLWFWNIKKKNLQHYSDLMFNKNIVLPNIDKYSIKNSGLSEELKERLILVGFTTIVQLEDFHFEGEHKKEIEKELKRVYETD